MLVDACRGEDDCGRRGTIVRVREATSVGRQRYDDRLRVRMVVHVCHLPCRDSIP